MNDDRFEALVGFVLALARLEEDLSQLVVVYQSNALDAERRANPRMAASVQELDKLRAERDSVRRLSEAGVRRARERLEGIARRRRKALEELAGHGPSAGAPREVWILRGHAHAVLLEEAESSPADAVGDASGSGMNADRIAATGALTHAGIRLRRALREVVERAPDWVPAEDIESHSCRIEAYRKRSPVERFFRGNTTLWLSGKVLTVPVLVTAFFLIGLLAALGLPIGIFLPAVFLVGICAHEVSAKLARAYDAPPLLPPGARVAGPYPSDWADAEGGDDVRARNTTSTGADRANAGLEKVLTQRRRD